MEQQAEEHDLLGLGAQVQARRSLSSSPETSGSVTTTVSNSGSMEGLGAGVPSLLDLVEEIIPIISPVQPERTARLDGFVRRMLGDHQGQVGHAQLQGDGPEGDVDFIADNQQYCRQDGV